MAFDSGPLKGLEVEGKLHPEKRKAPSINNEIEIIFFIYIQCSKEIRKNPDVFEIYAANFKISSKFLTAVQITESLAP